MFRGRLSARRPGFPSISWRFCGFAALAFSLFTACDSPSDPPPPKGSLTISISGLPDTIPASISLTGPGGYSEQVTGPKTISDLTPGSYTVSVAAVHTSAATFAPAFESLFVTVSANSVSQAAVIYAVATGSIAVNVTGTPPDVPWKVHVTGPGGYRDSLVASGTLGNLAPGIYSVSAVEVQKGASIYAPKPVAQVLTVNASLTPVPASISYSLITGSLSIHVNGLPSGVNGNVTISGPGEYHGSATGSITLEGLRFGRYDITAAQVAGSGGQFAATPPTQSVTVVPGAVGLVSVNYWRTSALPGLNLAIESVHLQQVVQTYGGAVPVIAGRDALLRVFVRASSPNAASAEVRVRLFDGTQQVATLSIPAPAPTVPTVVDEGNLGGSWNITIPASIIRPGLRILADVDPSNVIAESVEDDNSWPSSGTPLALDVRTTPPLAVRLVPVTQSSTGLTGNVNESNSAQYFEAARRLLPVGQLTMDVRQPYTTSAPPLQPADGNGAWVQIMNELGALRAAEGSTAHYYGVVKLPYTSGLIGISYLPSTVALGYDVLPNAAPTMVHELGHNFGRLHSGSCGAGGIDGNFPYPNGAIGVYGYDIASQALRVPATPDIMGYCTDRWISDYTYTGILGFRAQANLASPYVVASAPSRGLLVWGRITASGVVLEPSFEVTAPARLPAASGPHRLEILDETGRVTLSLPFRGERVVDSPRGDDEHFAFVIPIDALHGTTPSRLRLVSGGRRAEVLSQRRPLSEELQPSAQRLSPNQVRVRWRHAPGFGVIVRDAQTGAILSLARGGSADVLTSAPSVDLILSDGVRSARRSVLVR